MIALDGGYRMPTRFEIGGTTGVAALLARLEKRVRVTARVTTIVSGWMAVSRIMNWGFWSLRTSAVMMERLRLVVHHTRRR